MRRAEWPAVRSPNVPCQTGADRGLTSGTSHLQCVRTYPRSRGVARQELHWPPRAGHEAARPGPPSSPLAPSGRSLASPVWTRAVKTGRPLPSCVILYSFDSLVRSPTPKTIPNPSPGVAAHYSCSCRQPPAPRRFQNYSWSPAIDWPATTSCYCYCTLGAAPPCQHLTSA